MLAFLETFMECAVPLPAGRVPALLEKPSPVAGGCVSAGGGPAEAKSEPHREGFTPSLYFRNIYLNSSWAYKRLMA